MPENRKTASRLRPGGGFIENLISEGTYDDSAEDFDSKYIVEYCEISDVLAGKSEWHRAFSYKLGK